MVLVGLLILSYTEIPMQTRSIASSLFISMIFFAGLGFSQRAASQNEINPLQAQAFLKPSSFGPDQIVELEIKLRLNEGFKAYEDQFKVEVPLEEGFKVANFKISPIHEFFDEFSKKKRKGVINEATVTAAVRVPGTATSKENLSVRLVYQACTKSFCLFPKTLNLEVPFKWKNTQILPLMPKISGGATPSFFSSSFEDVFGHGLIWTFLFVFLAGILTSFTPCIFPMIPITLAVLSRDSHTRTRSQSFLVSLLYVSGIAITYAVMGLIAASTGALFGAALSSPWVLGVICIIFLAMSLSLFGFYELQAPLFIRQRFGTGPSMKGPFGVFLTGAFSGLVASPCVGPVLVGILAYVVRSQDLFLGFWLLFVFALGMGQIFLVLGVSTNLTKKLPRSGPWLDGVKQVSGLLMLGVFFYYLSLLLPLRLFDIASAIGLISLGSLGGAFTRPNTSVFSRLRKGFGIAAILFGAFLFVVGAFDLRPMLSSTTISGAGGLAGESAKPSLNWQPLTAEALAQAKTTGRPIMIDFYADWCAACHELDRYTFTQERVQTLAADFTVFRFDATRDSSELTAFKKEFGILGLPWVVFIDPKGHFRKDLTLTEFEEPVKFLNRMQRAQQ